MDTEFSEHADEMTKPGCQKILSSEKSCHARTIGKKEKEESVSFFACPFVLLSSAFTCNSRVGQGVEARLKYRNGGDDPGSRSRERSAERRGNWGMAQRRREKTLYLFFDLLIRIWCKAESWKGHSSCGTQNADTHAHHSRSACR